MAFLFRLCAMVASLAALSTQAAAEAPNLAGKNVQMIIGFGPGGLFDLWGRVVARHIGKHLPGNPSVVPQNMPGAGSFIAVNYIYNVAPKDGTVLGTIASAAALGPITGTPGGRFDPNKFSWLGTTTTETHVCVAYNSPTLKVKTVKDLYTNELTMGSTGNGALSDSEPKALSALLGLKFKAIAGFRSSADIFLAMERGEVDGVCLNLAGVNGVRPGWIRDNKLVVLLQGGGAPALKDVPVVNDLARTPEERQAIEFLYASGSIGRPFIAPPDLSADVLKMLRDAFTATMKDPEFLADAQKQNLDVNPEDGEYLTALVKRIYATPKPIVDKIVDLTK